MEFTPKIIKKLRENEVFVFGSNTDGEHYGGGAYQAWTEFGAKWGVAEGLVGQSYAIPTMRYVGLSAQKISQEELAANFVMFLLFAQKNKSKKFLLTKVGCGIAGWTEKEVAEILDAAASKIDGYKFDNVTIPAEFAPYVKDYDPSPRKKKRIVTLGGAMSNCGVNLRETAFKVTVADINVLTDILMSEAVSAERILDAEVMNDIKEACLKLKKAVATLDSSDYSKITNEVKSKVIGIISDKVTEELC